MAKMAEQAKMRTSAAAGKAMGIHNKSYQGTWKGTGGDPWLYSMDDAGNIAVWDTRDTAAGWKTLAPGSTSYNAVIEFIANPVTDDGYTRLERVSDRPHRKKGDPSNEGESRVELSPPSTTGADIAKAAEETAKEMRLGQSVPPPEAPFELPAQSEVPLSPEKEEEEVDPLAKARTHTAADKAAIAKHRKKSRFHEDKEEKKGSTRGSGFFQTLPWAQSNEPGPEGGRGA